MPDRNNRRASAAGAVKDRGPLRGVLRTSLTALLAPANLHLWGAEAPPLKRAPLYTLILPFSCPEDREHLPYLWLYTAWAWSDFDVAIQEIRSLEEEFQFRVLTKLLGWFTENARESPERSFQ